MKHPAAVGLLAGLIASVGIFAGAWSLRGSRDRAEIEAERAASAQRAYELGLWHQREIDSLARAEAELAQQHVKDSTDAAYLRAQAAAHATVDQALDDALAAASSARDSVPILLNQRDEARLAYAGAVKADSSARESARLELGRVRGIAEAKRVADSTMFAGRIDALDRFNAKLVLDVQRANDRGKVLGLFRIPEEVKLLAAGYVGCRVAGGCRWP